MSSDMQFDTGAAPPRATRAPPAEAVAAPQPTTVAEVPARRELTAEEKEFLDALSNLVLAVQELAYVLGGIDVKTLGDSPDLQDLLEASRNVVQAMRKFHKVVKARMRRA